MSKSFKRRKRKKIRQYHHECNKNLSEEQKQNKAEYMRNYYIRNNFWVALQVFKDPRAIKFIS